MAEISKQCCRKVKNKLMPLRFEGPLDLPLHIIEMKTGVEPAITFIVLSGFISIYLIFGWCNDFVCNFIGLIYPVYPSLWTVQSPGSFDHKKLLNYWIIYSSIGCIEYFLHKLCDLLLFYWFGKCVFLIWFLKDERELSTVGTSFESEAIAAYTAESILVSQKIQLSVPLRSTILNRNAKWKKNGLTVAGGNGSGNDLNQLFAPFGIFVDENQTVYIADSINNRIVEWKSGEKKGRVVAGGGDSLIGEHMLYGPMDVIIDRKRNSFIIADTGKRRVIRWHYQNDIQSETIIPNIDCRGITIDENGSIYVTDGDRHQVTRYDIGNNEGIIVAGGNGAGDALDQLNIPYSIFVAQDHSVYVSDGGNHRVMKWINGAKEGVVVAGGQRQGESLSQLNYPRGIVVDQSGTVYVADHLNGRVMRWLKDAEQGDIIAGGNGGGDQDNQLLNVTGLAFDKQGNLYIVDMGNSRVQMFNIDYSD
ncbi:unnamed protein product [Adineta ricciae]|uniref:Uncharacterized protein n=1 Tax=Adineta ricciae TaxID=249248 RepID=A0A815VZR9_ADIRI|nr:unnamed protein product [Adineta ricciae]